LGAASSTDDPAESQGGAALRTNFARYLVVSATDAAASNFHQRTGVLKSGLEDLYRIASLLVILDGLEGGVHDLASGLLLTAEHHVVDKLFHHLVAELHVRSRDISFLDWSSHIVPIYYLKRSLIIFQLFIS